MNYFDKTPNELVLEQKVSRLEAENKYLRQSSSLEYSCLAEPSVLVMTFPREATLKLISSVTIDPDPYGLHVYITDTRADGHHRKLDYYCSAESIINSTDRSYAISEMHKKLMFDLGRKVGY